VHALRRRVLCRLVQLVGLHYVRTGQLDNRVVGSYVVPLLRGRIFLQFYLEALRVVPRKLNFERRRGTREPGLVRVQRGLFEQGRRRVACVLVLRRLVL